MNEELDEESISCLTGNQSLACSEDEEIIDLKQISEDDCHGCLDGDLLRSITESHDSNEDIFGENKEIILILDIEDSLLDRLNQQRISRSFLLDVQLITSGGSLHCHKAVLAANSPYFKAMFENELKESSENKVTLENVSFDSLKTIIDWMYTMQLKIYLGHALDLLATARFLHFSSVVEACSKFLEKNLSVSNCLSILSVADFHSCYSLQTSTWKYILAHFIELSHQQKFSSLSEELLLKLIKSEDLKVPCEDNVLEAVMRWAEGNSGHTNCLPTLLGEVKLPLVSNKCLKTFEADISRVSSDASKHFKEARELKDLISGGKDLHSHRLLKPRASMLRHAVVVVGGMNTSRQWLPEVYAYDVDYKIWRELTKIPFHHTDYSVTALDEDIYVTGGFDGDGPVDDVLKYVTCNFAWKVCPSLIIPRFNHSSASMEGSVYVLGGEDNDNGLTSIEVLCKGCDHWDMVGQVNPVESNASVVALNGKIYIVGWMIYPVPNCVIQCFDLDTKECVVLPSSGLHRQLFPVVGLDGQIFNLGGRNIKEVSRYDPVTFQMDKAAPLKFKRNCPSATVVNRKIFVTGGELRHHLNKVESYDPDTDSWTIENPMPNSLCFHGCVGVKLYIGPPYYEVEEKVD